MSTAITVNGEQHSGTPATIAALLAELGIADTAKGVAVAQNGHLVRRADWAAAPIQPGDAIEIVRPFNGG